MQALTSAFAGVSLKPAPRAQMVGGGNATRQVTCMAKKKVRRPGGRAGARLRPAPRMAASRSLPQAQEGQCGTMACAPGGRRGDRGWTAALRRPPPQGGRLRR